MKRIKVFIIILCLSFVLIPFQAFAYWNNGTSDIATIHRPGVSNVDISSLLSSCKLNSHSLYLFYDTDASMYKMLEYAAKGGRDLRTYYGGNILNSTTYTSVCILHTFSSGASSYSSSNVNAQISTSNFVLLAAYNTRHPADDSYLEIGNFTGSSNDNVLVTQSNLDLPLEFADAGYIKVKGDEEGGSGSGSGTVTVDMTTTNNILREIKAAVLSVQSDLSQFKSSVESSLSTISSRLNTINSSITTMNSNLTTQFTQLKTLISTNYTNMTTYLTGKFTSLYNVIVYGNEEGEDENELQQMQLENMKTGMTSMNTNIGNVPTVINNAADGLGSYIDTFTELYNSFTALNVAISSILYLGLTFILVKKLIGR